MQPSSESSMLFAKFSMVKSLNVLMPSKSEILLLLRLKCVTSRHGERSSSSSISLSTTSCDQSSKKYIPVQSARITYQFLGMCNLLVYDLTQKCRREFHHCAYGLTMFRLNAGTCLLQCVAFYFFSFPVPLRGHLCSFSSTGGRLSRKHKDYTKAWKTKRYLC